MWALLANALWCLSALPESGALRRALRDVAATQERVLLRMVRRNAASEWGRHYGFAHIRSVRDYQNTLPLTSYADYRQAIERIGSGQPRVLTREPVLLLEPTSGSSAATKHIPYTSALKAEFQRALAPWVVNLFSHMPDLLCGPAYWSVSPVAQPNQRTAGGIPIGFADDSAYAGQVQQWLLRAVLAVPPQVRHIDDIETFRYVTLLFLLRRPDLRLISVWNPTFLALLVARLPEWWPALAADIAHGTLSPPVPLAPDIATSLQRHNRPAPRRAAAIAAACRATDYSAERHRLLWPRLRLISCWADAQAAQAVPEVARLFPQACIQGKGLLATEGCVSLPLLGVHGAVPALRSHFFEFLPLSGDKVPVIIDAGARPRLAHELEPGARYAVVLTTGGGLYRYQLHDVVEVTSRLYACPLLRFVGKLDHISDHFGEKLHAGHVQRALDDLLHQYGIEPVVAMLACELLPAGAAYILFIEAPGAHTDMLHRLGAALEARLCDNYHYAYCRRLGQLAALCVFRIDAQGHTAYLEHCRAAGQRLGDIKPTVLHRQSGWLHVFQGYMLE